MTYNDVTMPTEKVDTIIEILEEMEELNRTPDQVRWGKEPFRVEFVWELEDDDDGA